MSNIGMMDGAFFVGRKELVDWVNDTLDVNISKIEQTANGAFACQLLDIMYPGSVAMSKVDWSAKQDFQFIANYKVLQAGFNKNHIDKHIDVDRLIKGKYQDNLEFMQWFKRFYEMAVQDKGDYDTYGQRCRGKGGEQFNATLGRTGGATPSSRPTRTAIAKAPIPRPTSSNAKATKAASSSVAPAPAAAKKENTIVASGAKATTGAAAAAEISDLKAANDKLAMEYSDLKMEMEGLEKERNFYFDKLRDIEMMLQDHEDRGKGDGLTAAIFKILYATAEGFDRVDDIAFPEDVGPTEEEGADVETAPELDGEEDAVAADGEEEETY